MKNTFLENLADALECEVTDISLDSELSSYEGWDSIAALSVIAFADAEFNKNINGDQISECSTVNDLYILLSQ